MMADIPILYIVLFLGSVFLASVSQVLLKKAALKKYDSLLKEYLNPLVIGAYALFVTTTMLTLWAYKVIPLSLGQAMETTAYIYIVLFGVFVFKEKITVKKLLSLCMIVTGIIVFSLG